MLNGEQLAAIIDIGYEQRGVEFKSAGDRSDRSFLANVARATIALANQRDGGHLIIGLSENGVDDAASGLSPEQLDQWLSFDDVSDQINSYADPPVQIQLAQVQLPNERAVVVVEVSEFAEIPVLSKKDYPNRIAAKQLYTRSMAKPESSAALTQNELRDVITLATEKQLARFLETARRAGMGVGQPAAASARVQFEEQLSRALADDFHLDQTLPQLITTIRPAVFNARRIPFPELLPAVQNAVVRRRGRPFPFMQNPISGRDWVGEQVSSMHPGTWQLFESGQFLDSRFIEAYGPDSDGFLDEGQVIRGYLPIWLPLLHFTEGIEFAGRLQRASFEAEPVTITLSLHNIRRFVLVTAHRSRSGLHGTYVYNDDTWDYEIQLSPEEGLTSTRALAAEAALDLLQRFGWRGVTLDILRDIQTESFGPEPQ